MAIGEVFLSHTVCSLTTKYDADIIIIMCVCMCTHVLMDVYMYMYVSFWTCCCAVVFYKLFFHIALDTMLPFGHKILNNVTITK